MKIIKNNMKPQEIKKSKFPMRLTCENCGSEFEVEEDDIEVGYLGLYQLPNGCPCCGEEIEIDDSDELTSENLRFPQHYFSFKNGVKLSDEEINNRVKKCIETLRNSDDKTFYHTNTGTGSCYISVTRYDGDEEFVVQVTKDYYETNIPYTDEDKEKWC